MDSSKDELVEDDGWTMVQKTSLSYSYLGERVLGVQRVHAQVAEGGAEEVLLGAVLEQGGLQGSCRYLEQPTRDWIW
jgi:hypothetical protein